MKKILIWIMLFFNLTLLIKHELNVHELRRRYNGLWKCLWDITEVMGQDYKQGLVIEEEGNF